MANDSLFGNLHKPFVVDLFSGGGGASHGMHMAGRTPTIAINHDADAIAMHAANHPTTTHYLESVYDVKPSLASKGRRPDILWCSPACTHFSRARGGVPKSEQSRSLAWVIVDWAREVSPRCIIVENVPEWASWGVLDAEGEPVKARAGETFREFIAALRDLGYAVEHRLLVAADYGSPTSRKRLYLVARRDGPVRWPAPTHGKGRKPYRTAAECIDWSIPIPSIFTRKKPLAAATQRRIAKGIRRFVLNNPHPFLLTLTHGGRLVPMTEPIPTVTAAHRGETALVTPFLDKMYSSAKAGQKLDEPAATVTGGGTHAALIAPTLLSLSHGGQHAPVDRPIRTLTATPDGGDQCGVAATLKAAGSQGGCVAAFLARHFTGCEGGDLERPMPTVTAVDHHAVVAAHLMSNNSNNAPHGADEPLGSITTGNRHFAVAAELAAPFLTAGHARGWDTPENSTQPADAPVPTVLAKDARLLVAAFMQAYYGTDEGRSVADPMGTVVTKDRFGLVTVTIRGEPYVITDIGMRMLQPRELATAQGFPPEYVLTGTKTSQVARIGNAVCPQVAEAITRANI